MSHDQNGTGGTATAKLVITGPGVYQDSAGNPQTIIAPAGGQFWRHEDGFSYHENGDPVVKGFCRLVRRIGDIDAPAETRPQNPPAFPTPHDPERTGNEGMSLRDWFAGQAHRALVADLNRAPVTWMREADEDGIDVPAAVARAAYIHADAMLAAREGGAA